MKTQFNITTSDCDLERYTSWEDFLSALEGFDGVELMYCGEDTRGILPPDQVVGLHMSCPYYWLDFWQGNLDRCLQEFGSMENLTAYYGGSTPQALLDSFRRDVALAKKYRAEYMVFHVADSSSYETLTGRYTHRDEEVIDGVCELINQALPAESDGPWLLLENLWEPGLTFTRPDMTRCLLSGVHYPKTGIMLDTGHLMHTEPSLSSQEEALAYLHRRLDEHGELCRHIRGIHLNQSLTGAYMEQVRHSPPPLSPDWAQRSAQLFTYVFQVDQHLPFTCPGVADLIRRIHPDYLTYEFISSDRAQHQSMLRQQQLALGRIQEGSL